MRIIDRIDPEVEITCEHCKSRMAATMADITLAVEDIRDPASERVSLATCPVCLSVMRIPTNTIPERWHDHLVQTR